MYTKHQNALNQRVAKEVNGTITQKYLWADLTTLLAIYDKDDNLIQRFEYANQRIPIAMTDKDNNRYYLHYDQVGSLRAISDKDHNIIKEITYDTYGNIINDTNPDFKVSFGFAGGLYDSDTKLVHFGYREYDSFTGKWTAKDPIGFQGGDSNLYGYVLQDPVDLVDPEGLKIIILGNEKEKQLLNKWLNNLAQVPELNNRIKEMQSTQELFYIKFDDKSAWYGGGSYQPRDNTCSISPKLQNDNQKDFWYGSGGLFNHSNEYFHGQSVLAHELLGHGYDDMKGLGRNENRAIGIANKYREFKKWPLRNYK